MSYHEIEVLPSYSLKCRQCAFVGWARTPGIAEQMAIDHIEVELVGTAETPNYEHHVEISDVIIVGRGL